MADQLQVKAIFNVYKHLIDAWRFQFRFGEVEPRCKLALSVVPVGDRSTAVDFHYKISAGTGFDIDSNYASLRIVEQIEHILDRNLWKDKDPIFLGIMPPRALFRVNAGLVAAKPEGEDEVDYYCHEFQSALNYCLRYDADSFITWGYVLRNTPRVFKNPAGVFVF